jgi:myo-inositol-1(or 4)-monophosphatase
MQPMLNIAIRAARMAVTIILKKSDDIPNVKIRNKRVNDFVTSVDLACEKEIIYHLHKAYPDHQILSEECGLIGNPESDYKWIVDPLDGTTNFIKQLNYSAVSIALQVKGRTELAVIYNPFANDLFTALRGSGAQLNERKIRVSNKRDISGSFLSTGISASNKFKSSYTQELISIRKEILSFRYGGSLALDLANVACGRFDAGWTVNAEIWDIAAVDLLVREAGGVVSELDGNVNYLTTGSVICGNSKIVSSLLKRISPHIGSDLEEKLDAEKD